MKITDEMIIAMQDADVATRHQNPDDLATHEALITSVYPLIKAQVIEECAKVCEKYGENQDASFSDSGLERACAAVEMVEAIRDMKGDV